MPSPSAAPPQPEAAERLPLLFLGIALVEAVTIAGLYWLGQYFSA